MIPTIGSNRPPAPQEWVTGAGMDRHHILPYSTLRDTWNTLIGRFCDTQLNEARTAIRQFLGVSARIKDVESVLERLRTGQLADEEALMLQTVAVWTPWNIAIGPKNRSDNPGNYYIDRFTFGITREEFVRMRTIEFVYSKLQHFNNLAEHDAAELKVLADTLSIARSDLIFVDAPIPFRPEMWEQDPDGRWRKRRSGEQFLTPVVGRH